jgi:aminoglycoside phosphotransferase (APT) family kinase protein
VTTYEASDAAEPEVMLTGGLANAGKVVRVGNTVRRPHGAHGDAVVAFMSHLRASGFEGVPRFHGIDQKGRAIFDYLDGDVDRDTDPVWAREHVELESVARLQRRMHDAARSFLPPPSAVWDDSLAAPPPWRSGFVSHNDLCVSNVVVRDGKAHAFIDFDFAAPTHPLWDVAVALRHWVPVKDPIDDDPSRRLELDLVDRFRLYCDAYGTTSAERALVVEMLGVFLDQALVNMRTRFESGVPAYVTVWNNGYPDQNRRSRTWLDAHASRLGR